MNIKNFMKAVAAIGALVAASSAHSSSVQLDKTLFAGAGTGPYGTVTWTQNGVNVDFVVSLRGDMDFVNTGSKTQFTFNAKDVVIADVINWNFASGSTGTYTVIANAPQAGLGTFSLGIDCTSSCQNGSPGRAYDPLKFTVKNAVESDFGFGLAASNGAWFSADVISDTVILGSDRQPLGNTGVIYTTGQTSVPEPATLGLLGLGLAGVGFARRRKVAA